MIAAIKPTGHGLETDFKVFFKGLLEKKAVDALVLPIRQADGISVMPALITAPEQVDQARILGPSFFINSARMVSRLSFKETGRKTAVWLRPCEIRAFIELVKLNQGRRDELLIMGMDCPMALSRQGYADYVDSHGQDLDHWGQMIYPDPVKADIDVCETCKVCDAPFPVNADISVFLYGKTMDQPVVLEANTPVGKTFITQAGLEPVKVESQESQKRESVLKALVKRRKEVFDTMAQEIEQETSSIEKLGRFFSSCINCYNCRNVCPVCYCRECVFNTDVFSHDPIQYHQWADRWGQVKLPSDTLFYHLTRMAHISHACVGCGQCTLACPSQIPVASLFKVVAVGTQGEFGYEPGGDDPPPLSIFEPDEFQQIVGIE